MPSIDTIINRQLLKWELERKEAASEKAAAARIVRWLATDETKGGSL